MKIIYSILFFIYISLLSAQELPDFSDITDIPSEQITETEQLKRTPLENIKLLQNNGTTIIDRKLKKLKDDFTLFSVIVIIAFSFLYGVFHTIGSGHGKMIIFSYFIADNRSKWDITALSILVPLIHTSGAIILAILLRTLLSFVSGFSVLAIQYAFTMISGLLIAGVSVYLIINHNRKYNLDN